MEVDLHVHTIDVKLAGFQTEDKTCRRLFMDSQINPGVLFKKFYLFDVDLCTFLYSVLRALLLLSDIFALEVEVNKCNFNGYLNFRLVNG